MNWMPVCAKISSRGTTLKRRFQHAVVARVAIVAWIVDQRAIRAQQREIHAPRVDADAIQREAPFAAGDGQPLLHFMPEPQRVPVECGVNAHRRVGKPVQLFQREPSRFERTENGAAALRAKIKRQISGHQGMPESAL